MLSFLVSENFFSQSMSTFRTWLLHGYMLFWQYPLLHNNFWCIIETEYIEHQFLKCVNNNHFAILLSNRTAFFCFIFHLAALIILYKQPSATKA